MNERLRGALAQQRISAAELGKQIGVDEKSVQRWMSTGRRPHARNQRAAASALGVSPAYLWPGSEHHDTYVSPGSRSEIVATYPDRASVPQTVWRTLLERAEEHIDVLVFSGTFLAQSNPRLPAMLGRRAAAGAKVRLCFGDPDSAAVALRGEEEGIGSALGAKIQASLSYFTDLAHAPGCEVRLHGCALYASIFRYDSDAMINPHIWGSPASANPLLHIRDAGEDSMFDKYAESFEKVWDRAKPWGAA